MICGNCNVLYTIFLSSTACLLLQVSHQVPINPSCRPPSSFEHDGQQSGEGKAGYMNN